jgi:hypothetical protein
MEFKTYAEIDLNETPIAVLGCGHFFTGETLDGMVGMNNVYATDRFGDFNGLQDLSGQLSAIPTCPDCRVPIRQFATRRYNRVINKAVLDETSKRFLVGGHRRLDELEKMISAAEKELSETSDSTASAYLALGKPTPNRYKVATALDKNAGQLRRDMDSEHQPTKKLFDAVTTFQRLDREAASALEKRLEDLNISQPSAAAQSHPPPVYDQQITLGAHRLQLRIQEAVLRDTFTILSKRNAPFVPSLIPGGPPEKRTTRFLGQCTDLITKATEAKLPRLTIPATLSYARIAQLEAWYRRTTNNTNSPIDAGTSNGTMDPAPMSSTETARHLLDSALALCDTLPDETDLRAEVEETMRLYSGPRYETVTPEEIAAIKSAMVDGAGGIATHSGHWYRCANGHPVSYLPCCIFLPSNVLAGLV